MGVYSKALPTVWKRLVEGKQVKFDLREGARREPALVLVIWQGFPDTGLIMCKWNEKWSFQLWKGNVVFSIIVWKQSSSLQFSVFMNGTFLLKGAGDSKSLTSLGNDICVTHISFGRAIHFTPESPSYLHEGIFPKGTQPRTFNSLSTRTRYNELWLQWPTSRSVPANV